MGKARVAPLKQTSIPRMELTAALVASRMDKMWKKELQMHLQESVFWTDSTSVLRYISNETSRFKVFVANRVTLREAVEGWNQAQIQEMLLQKGIKWIFNPPAGSHHGGVWERLIRSVRKVLNSILKVQNLDEEGLCTVLCEAEAIVNSRPITKASTDPNDLEALTPNHLLLLKTKPLIPPGVFQKGDVYGRRRWRQVQYMSDLFWKRWVKEYLPQLQERQKWQRIGRNFIPGDVVIVVDDSAPRNSWVTGRIVEAISDSKGLVRRVRVKTKTGCLDRPITKVCLLQEAEES
ncbi:uncharacterized protein LOC121812301 [Haplochromis burtoni]|uniref:uncharacterized protein LOC121812301 n=1 Tax=Haplochromis burtoni TaxID=8153 RepID=UPI001C2D3AB7|nr:uncharacterized protein LOC121812301 [Haplochromis burtoni]